MAYFILRLDDACPQMNKKKWEDMEKLLNQYGIQPIVGQMAVETLTEIFLYDIDKTRKTARISYLSFCS